MRQRPTFFIWIGVGVLFGALAIVALRPTEPSYDGRSLNTWVRLCLEDSPATRTIAASGIRQIGTNAIPFLLKWIRYDPPAWKTSLYAMVGRFKKLEDSRELLARATAQAFAALGAQGKGAIGELSRLMKDSGPPAVAWRATYSVGFCGHEALPILVGALTNRQVVAPFRDLYAWRIGLMETNAL